MNRVKRVCISPHFITINREHGCKLYNKNDKRALSVILSLNKFFIQEKSGEFYNSLLLPHFELNDYGASPDISDIPF